MPRCWVGWAAGGPPRWSHQDSGEPRWFLSTCLLVVGWSATCFFFWGHGCRNYIAKWASSSVQDWSRTLNPWKSPPRRNVVMDHGWCSALNVWEMSLHAVKYISKSSGVCNHRWLVMISTPKEKYTLTPKPNRGGSMSFQSLRTGGKALKSTQVYPEAYGKKICELHSQITVFLACFNLF